MVQHHSLSVSQKGGRLVRYRPGSGHASSCEAVAFESTLDLPRDLLLDTQSGPFTGEELQVKFLLDSRENSLSD
jgi:hypothetical protein